MAVLSKTVKLEAKTYLGATQRDAINTGIDTYLLNAPDGVATGASIFSDSLLVDEGRGAQLLVKAVIVGAGEGKTSTAARVNESHTFTKTIRLDNLSTDIAALETGIQTWLDNGTDGLAAGAPVAIKLSGKNIDSGVIEISADVHVGNYSEYSYPEDYTLFVRVNGSDTTGTGTADNPFATPQGAVNEVIARADNYLTVPYVIDIGAGIFAGMNLGNAEIVCLTVKGAGKDATAIMPSSGNAVTSTTANDSQTVLRFKDLRLINPVALAGASDATNFGSDLFFDSCVISDTLSVSNAVQAVFTNCAIKGATTFENVGTVIYGSDCSHSGATLTLNGDNAAAKKPSGWSGVETFVISQSARVACDVSIDAVKDDVQLEVYGAIEDDIVGGGASTTVIMSPTAYIWDDVSIPGVLSSFGGVIGGDLEFTSSSTVSVLRGTLVGGNFTIDPAVTSVTLIGAGYGGTLTDAGSNLVIAAYYPLRDQLAGKIDVISTPTLGAIPTISASGQLTDSGVLLSTIPTSVSSTRESCDDTFRMIGAIPVAVDTVVRFKAELVALTDAATDGAGYTLVGTARRATAGNVTMIGTATVLDADEDTGALDVTAVANTGTQTIDIQVKGAAIVEAGDAANQMSAWGLTGISATNSDSGVVYWGLVDDAGTRTVSLYSDNAGVNLVAQGSLAGDGTIALAESNGSGLSGTVTVAYTGDDVTFAANTLTTTVHNWSCVYSTVSLAV